MNLRRCCLWADWLLQHGALDQWCLEGLHGMLKGVYTNPNPNEDPSAAVLPDDVAAWWVAADRSEHPYVSVSAPTLPSLNGSLAQKSIVFLQRHATLSLSLSLSLSLFLSLALPLFLCLSVCLSVCVGLWMCVCVCMCVRVREREGERVRERERERERELGGRQMERGEGEGRGGVTQRAKQGEQLLRFALMWGPDLDPLHVRMGNVLWTTAMDYSRLQMSPFDVLGWTPNGCCAGAEYGASFGM
jgi:hypothetical protein